MRCSKVSIFLHTRVTVLSPPFRTDSFFRGCHVWIYTSSYFHLFLKYWSNHGNWILSYKLLYLDLLLLSLCFCPCTCSPLTALLLSYLPPPLLISLQNSSLLISHFPFAFPCIFLISISLIHATISLCIFAMFILDRSTVCLDTQLIFLNPCITRYVGVFLFNPSTC